MGVVKGFQLLQGDETLHHSNKLYIHHRPFRVVLFAGWVVMGIIFLKLCVVWVSLLYDLKANPKSPIINFLFKF